MKGIGDVDHATTLGWRELDAVEGLADALDKVVVLEPFIRLDFGILHDATDLLFTGDHIMSGSTVVIDPPDGNMKQYIESLRRVRGLNCSALAPGHGELIHDPERVVDWIVDHRLAREAKVVAALRANPNLTARELVPHVYKDVDQKLYGWAERSLLAHVLKLEADGILGQKNKQWNRLI